MTTDLQTRPLPRVPRALDGIYRLGLLSKASVALLQFCAGLGLWLAPAGSLSHLVEGLSTARLLHSPLHPLLPALHHWAAALPDQTSTFYATYLMGHGALSCCVLLAVFLRRRFAYPVAMMVLSGFVIYQLGEYLQTHDPALLLITTVDLIVIFFISVERLFSPYSGN
ncbi:DUF2127 domain-containing protein [Puniceibacterium sediminis]|nr:DUF2127 domain-containing protein [Puniceibacterium sediminis]